MVLCRQCGNTFVSSMGLRIHLTRNKICGMCERVDLEYEQQQRLNEIQQSQGSQLSVDDKQKDCERAVSDEKGM